MITQINFNWGYSIENGEEYSSYTVGKDCESITEHPAKGEGDKWYYEVLFDDQRTVMIFNPNQVFKQF